MGAPSRHAIITFFSIQFELNLGLLLIFYEKPENTEILEKEEKIEKEKKIKKRRKGG